MSGCGHCHGPVGPKNRSGYCRACAPRFGKPADMAARISAGLKRKYAADPIALELLRQRARIAGKLPQAVAARKASAKAINLSEIGKAAQKPDARKRAGRTASRTKLSWCPPELIDEYRRLVRSCRMTTVEAKAAILEQHEAELRRLRARMGVTGPVVVPEPRFVMTGYDRPPEDNTFRRAEAHKAEKARIDALRQRRTLCPICGARSDVGCEHGEAA